VPRSSQIINGREYAYEYKSVWNKEKQRSEQKREYIGRIIDGEFVPNKNYQLREKLSKERETPDKPGPVPAIECKRLFSGATYLLDQLGETLGIEIDLESCFPSHHREILSLAYYLALEPSSPLYRFKRWAATHKHPYGKDIPSQRSSEILPVVTESAKMDFFRKQSKRHSESEYLFYDSTSISSYSEQLKQVKYGKNKDGDKLAQINLALLLGQSSGLPVYYRKLPGNITDVTTITNLLTGIEYLDLNKTKIVMDRGFYSAKNVNELFKGHHKFLIGGKISLKFIQEQLKTKRENFDRRENYNSDTALFIMSQTIDWDYEETKPRSGEVINEKRRMYVHIYYNDQKATDDKLRFNKMLDSLEEELKSGKRKEEHEKSYSKYFDVTVTPVRGVKVTPIQKAIDNARKDYGFFVLLSNGVKDPIEALNLYRSKDVIEKAFNDLKSRLNMRRTSVSSEENMEGKLFLQYIGLIYLLHIKHAMEKVGLFKKYTMQELFDELDVIELYQQPGGASYYGEMTEKQRDIYIALGVNPPKASPA
jgi:Transposase